MPAQAAATPPIRIWPSKPTLIRRLRKATIQPSATSVSGSRNVSVRAIAMVPPNDPATRALIASTESAPASAMISIETQSAMASATSTVRSASALRRSCRLRSLHRSRHQEPQLLEIDIVDVEDCHKSAADHDGDAVAEREDLLELGGDQQRAAAGALVVEDLLVDVLDCAHIESTCGLGRDQQPGLPVQRARKHRLLLVSARHGRGSHLEVGRADVVLRQQAPPVPAHFVAADEATPAEAALR